jgi:hypothetical protein
MRNLVLLDVHFSDLVSAGNTSHVAAIATDPSSSSLYAILQTTPSLDGSITLSVFLIAPNQVRLCQSSSRARADEGTPTAAESRH